MKLGIIIFFVFLLTLSLPKQAKSSIQSGLYTYNSFNIFDFNLFTEDFGKTGTAGWIFSDIISDGRIDDRDYRDLISKIGSNPSCETRGVWINNGAIRDSSLVHATYNDIVRSNLNAVFVISYTLNNNWGSASQANWEEFYNLLVRRGIKVYVVLNSHRRINGNESAIDYSLPSEWEAQAQWGLDFLNKYSELSGVQYDNLRYPATAPFQTSYIADLDHTVQRIHDKIKPVFPDKKLAFFDGQTDPVPRQANVPPPTWLSVWLANHPVNSYQFNGGQYFPEFNKYDRLGWILNGWMDIFFSGGYSTSVALWNRRTALWKEILDGENTKYLDNIYFGVPWRKTTADIVWPDGNRYPGAGTDQAAAVEMIKAARTSGMKGAVIFQYESSSFNAPLVNALTVDGPVNNLSAPYKNQADSCL